MSNYKLILKDAKEATISGRQNLKIKFQQELGIPLSSVESLFSSLPAVIKENLEQEKADKYFEIFQQLGADVEIKPEEELSVFDLDENSINQVQNKLSSNDAPSEEFNQTEIQSSEDTMMQMDSVITDAAAAASSVSAMSSLGSTSDELMKSPESLLEESLEEITSSEEETKIAIDQESAEPNEEIVFTEEVQENKAVLDAPQEQVNPQIPTESKKPSALELATMPSDEEPDASALQTQNTNEEVLKNELGQQVETNEHTSGVIDSLIQGDTSNQAQNIAESSLETSNEESLLVGSQEKINMAIFEEPEEPVQKVAEELNSEDALSFGEMGNDELLLSEPELEMKNSSQDLNEFSLSQNEEVVSSDNIYEEFEEVASTPEITEEPKQAQEQSSVYDEALSSLDDLTSLGMKGTTAAGAAGVALTSALINKNSEPEKVPAIESSEDLDNLSLESLTGSTEIADEPQQPIEQSSAYDEALSSLDSLTSLGKKGTAAAAGTVGAAGAALTSGLVQEDSELSEIKSGEDLDNLSLELLTGSTEVADKPQQPIEQSSAYDEALSSLDDLKSLGMKGTAAAAGAATAAGAALTSGLVKKDTEPQKEPSNENSEELDKLSKELEDQFSLISDKKEESAEVEQVTKKAPAESLVAENNTLEAKEQDSSKEEIIGKIKSELKEIEQEKTNPTKESPVSSANKESSIEDFDLSSFSFDDNETENVETAAKAPELENIDTKEIEKTSLETAKKELPEQSKEKSDSKFSSDSLLSDLEASLGEFDSSDETKSEEKLALKPEEEKLKAKPEKKSLTKSAPPSLDLEEKVDADDLSFDDSQSEETADKAGLGDDLVFDNTKEEEPESTDLSFEKAPEPEQKAEVKTDEPIEQKTESKESEVEIKPRRKRAPSRAFTKTDETFDEAAVESNNPKELAVSSPFRNPDVHSSKTKYNDTEQFENFKVPKKKTGFGVWALIFLSLGTLIAALVYAILTYTNQKDGGAIDNKTAELILNKNNTFKEQQAAKIKKASKEAKNNKPKKLKYEALSVNDDLSFKMNVEADNKTNKIKTIDILIKQQSSAELTSLQISNDEKRKPWLRRFEASIIKKVLKEGDIEPKTIVEKSYAYIDNGIKAQRTPATLTINPEFSSDSGEILGNWTLKSNGAEDYDKGKIKTIAGPSGDSYELYLEGSFLAEKVK